MLDTRLAYWLGCCILVFSRRLLVGAGDAKKGFSYWLGCLQFRLSFSSLKCVGHHCSQV